MSKCKKCGKRLRRNYNHGKKSRPVYSKSCNCDKYKSIESEVVVNEYFKNNKK